MGGGNGATRVVYCLHSFFLPSLVYLPPSQVVPSLIGSVIGMEGEGREGGGGSQVSVLVRLLPLLSPFRDRQKIEGNGAIQEELANRRPTMFTILVVFRILWVSMHGVGEDPSTDCTLSSTLPILVPFTPLGSLLHSLPPSWPHFMEWCMC